MIGEIISHYRILEKLGEGGMGVVYKAEDIKLKRIVALKFLPRELTRDPGAKERFVHEAQAASSLDHPNICNIHEIDETDDGQIFICMAYYEGESLKERIARGPLEVMEAARIAFQIAKGLGRAHESGIVHRDIKPANIVITGRGEVKIVDFGLAKLGGRTKLTKVGTTVGTVAYMSPEQTRGREVDHRSDIWSLGAVFHEMLTGRVPFKGDYEQAVIYSILNEEPEPITSSRDDVPTELQTIVNACLAKDPEQRYQTIKDILEDLMMLEGLDVATATSASVSGKKKRPHANKKRLWLPIAIAALVIVVAILVFNVWYSHRRVSYRLSSGSLEEGEQDAAPPLAQPVAAFDNSIVVLPFDDISPGKDNEYFSDGLTEEIITDLSRISSLRVISRTSAMKFKGAEKDVRTIGRELNVRYVLEGSVRKIDGDLRITAQLIDATNDAHIWADKYKGTLDDVFDIQENVSRAIVGALKLTLSSEEEKTITNRPIDDAIAFEHYFRAKQEIRKLTAEGLDRARTYIQAGLERIGDNELLYQGMGLIEWEYYNLGLSSDEAYLDRVEGYAAKIFELKPDSPRGYFLRGLIDITRGNPREGAANLNRVLDVEPKDYDSMRWLIVIYSYTGKIAAALSMAERVAEIDPIASDKIFCWLGLMDGSFKKFYECAHGLYQEDSNSLSARLHYILAVAYAEELDQFYALVDQLAQEMPEHFAAKLLLFMSYAFQKRNEEALQIMTSEFQTIAGRSWQYAWHIAAGYAMMDENAKAVEWLENAVNRGFINYPLLAEMDPFMENIRGDDGFKQLMERVKNEWERFEP